jgi:hypothetical protein
MQPKAPKGFWDNVAEHTKVVVRPLPQLSPSPSAPGADTLLRRQHQFALQAAEAVRKFCVRTRIDPKKRILELHEPSWAPDWLLGGASAPQQSSDPRRGVQYQGNSGAGEMEKLPLEEGLFSQASVDVTAGPAESVPAQGAPIIKRQKSDQGIVVTLRGSNRVTGKSTPHANMGAEDRGKGDVASSAAESKHARDSAARAAAAAAYAVLEGTPLMKRQNGVDHTIAKGNVTGMSGKDKAIKDEASKDVDTGSWGGELASSHAESNLTIRNRVGGDVAEVAQRDAGRSKNQKAKEGTLEMKPGQQKMAGLHLPKLLSSIHVPSCKEYLGAEKHEVMLEKVMAFLGASSAALGSFWYVV